MDNLELKETVKSYFPNLEEEALNSIIKHSPYLKCNKGENLIFERKRHHTLNVVLH